MFSITINVLLFQILQGDNLILRTLFIGDYPCFVLFYLFIHSDEGPIMPWRVANALKSNGGNVRRYYPHRKYTKHFIFQYIYIYIILYTIYIYTIYIQYIYIQYIYNIYTISIQYIYNIHTIYIQYTYTIYIQYLYYIYKIYIQYIYTIYI